MAIATSNAVITRVNTSHTQHGIGNGVCSNRLNGNIG